MEKLQQPLFFIVGIIAVAIVLWIFSPLFFETAPTNRRLALGPEGQEAGVIQAKHQFKDGMHMFAGTVYMPTPCHALLTRTSVNNTNPEKVEFSFTTREGSGVCAQVVTPQTFFITFKANPEAIVSATVNKEPVSLSVTEVPEGTDFGSFR